MVKGHYKRFSRDRMLENFNAIGEGIIGGFGGWISGQGQAGVERGFLAGYGDARSFQRSRKKWLRKSTVGSARSLYGSRPTNYRNPVYGSNPRPPVYGSNPKPPIYGSPPDPRHPHAPPILQKLQVLGNYKIEDYQPLEGTWIG